ncbi:hypothetical protein E5A73_20220 [Sphingomonas gei]|uniref:Uncharacterized protein n=1 Tax=Sphingomonas gei TaxID=1395960 RepID=A0A4S1WZW7_9SPHN|nr:hypothetical protein [Sphingomonas gei]TGX49164.1 hypothetical protein E5A73_20220 [Sphingomonas gei]
MLETERAREQLRQEREAFEQMRREVARWSLLRLCMGYGGLGLMTGIAAIAGIVVLHPNEYGPVPVGAAATALLIDMVSLAASISRLVLSRSSMMVLEPLTQSAAHGRRSGRSQ